MQKSEILRDHDKNPLEKKLLNRFLGFSLGIALIYTLIVSYDVIFREIPNVDKQLLLGSILPIFLYGGFFLIRNKAIAKFYSTVILLLSIIGSFLTYNGIFGLFILDLTNWIIFIYLVYSSKIKTYLYVITILILLCLISIQITSPELMLPETLLVGKLADHLIFIISRLLITINMVYYVKLKYDQERTNLLQTILLLEDTQNLVVEKEKMASLGTLMASVAHEINNPLNYISGGINIISQIKKEMNEMKDKDLKERFDKATEIVEVGLKKVTGIVSALKTFSHKGSANLIDTDLEDIIDNTLIFLKSKISDDIKIIKDYQLKVQVPAYPEKIHQLVMNIIDNAIFEVGAETLLKKEIKIATKKDKKSAIITITNKGRTIPNELLNYVFDPFFTTKEPGIGTGLGLSICYSIIQDHDGIISVVNNSDGVTFKIELPLE